MEPDEDDLYLAALAQILAAQAAGLHRVFMRAVADMMLVKTRSFRDVGRALKAQHQCRSPFASSLHFARRSRRGKIREIEQTN